MTEQEKKKISRRAKMISAQIFLLSLDFPNDTQLRIAADAISNFNKKLKKNKS